MASSATASDCGLGASNGTASVVKQSDWSNTSNDGWKGGGLRPSVEAGFGHRGWSGLRQRRGSYWWLKFIYICKILYVHTYIRIYLCIYIYRHIHIYTYIYGENVKTD